MGTRMLFEFFGDRQVDRTLARIVDNVTDASPAWEKIADEFARIERQQFNSQGHHGSGGWSPLSPQYAAWKARNFPGQPIMVRSGNLRDQLTNRPFGIEEITPDSMAIGADVDYGAYHQKGDGVPMRKVVDITEQDRREWARILQRHIMSER